MLELCVQDAGDGMDAAQQRRALAWLSTKVEVVIVKNQTERLSTGEGESLI
eukprot:SAG11_NODE_1785_length_4258_cov_5.997836_4_plen_51_part_00